MRLETTRNGNVFDAAAFRASGRTVLIVGLGMLGSHIAEQLAKLGLDLTLCDFDEVEAHNISNQAVGLQEIGMLKAEAMKKRLERDCGISVTAVTTEFDESLLPASVVFVAPDSNDVRREIWGKVKQRLNVELFIEVRTGTFEGRVYCLDPWDSVHARTYEHPSILYPDSAAVDQGEQACQQKTSLAFTGSAIAGMAVAQFIRWYGVATGHDDTLDNEIIFSLCPAYTTSRRFE